MVAAASTLLLAATASAAPARLEVGAGRAEVAITPAMLPLDGFGAVHDPLRARVLLLAMGGERMAIADIDQTSLFDDVITRMRAAVASATGTDPAHVLVVASHTFSAPHAFSADHLPPGMTLAPEEAGHGAAYQAALLAAVEQAAQAASSALTPATLHVGEGVSDVNISRNLPTAAGWWLGANPAATSDKHLTTLRFDGADGRPLAVVMNYAVQSSVLDHSVNAAGVKSISADLGGAAAARVEQALPGAVVLFLTGAAGDQAPAYTARRMVYDAAGTGTMVDGGDEGFTLLARQGERLGADALRTQAQAGPSAAPAPLELASGSVELDRQDRPHDLAQIHATHSFHYAVTGKVRAPYVLVRIGDTAIVGVQAELSAATGEAIRRQSPFAHTLVVTMVNGAAKYMPDAEAYTRITYEAMNSGYGPGSAEIFAQHILADLRKLHGAG